MHVKAIIAFQNKQCASTEVWSILNSKVIGFCWQVTTLIIFF